MSIGIVSESEFEAELTNLGSDKSDKPDYSNNPKSNQSNQTNQNRAVQEAINELKRPGRKLGDNNIPDVVRRILADNAIEEGNKDTKTLARALGVSDSSLSAYKHGATSTGSYNEPNKELKEHTDKTRLTISSRARNKLMKAMKYITDEKLVNAKPKDLSDIARNMSSVIKNVESGIGSANSGHNQPTFVFYTPPVKSEEKYDVIVLKE